MVSRAKMGAVTFGLFGLVGPFLQLLVTLLPAWDRWSTTRMVVEGWVTMLWPIRLFAMATPNDSTQLLLVLLVVGNVLLFAVLGAGAGFLSFSSKAAGLLAGVAVATTLFVSRFLVGSLSSARTWAVVVPVLAATVALLWRLQRKEAAEIVRG